MVKKISSKNNWTKNVQNPLFLSNNAAGARGAVSSFSEHALTGNGT